MKTNFTCVNAVVCVFTIILITEITALISTNNDETYVAINFGDDIIYGIFNLIVNSNLFKQISPACW